MFFSRITVRPDAGRAGAFWSAFRSSYSLHKAVWGLFGDHPDRERDFLYQVTEGAGPPVVYALSARPLAEGSELWQAESKPFAPRLCAGMLLGFQLRANPVVTRRPETPDPNPKKRKRHDVVMEAKYRLKTKGVARGEWPTEAELVQEASGRWLGERAEKGGFRVESVRADSYRQHEFWKKGGSPVRLSTVDFAGVLEVVDPIRFVEQLRDGIGPAKGFGCGLMLIRRV
ncbi:MAG: type I-E CRISPR-associated protein Cas6/Cse3/CasE [Deferrisomatales bacterium]|nr:type I-E CRISPR-associated protein Cas6/Cse3/CasE [Deferrisomatales bacterium]